MRSNCGAPHWPGAEEGGGAGRRLRGQQQETLLQSARLRAARLGLRSAREPPAARTLPHTVRAPSARRPFSTPLPGAPPAGSLRLAGCSCPRCWPDSAPAFPRARPPCGQRRRLPGLPEPGSRAPSRPEGRRSPAVTVGAAPRLTQGSDGRRLPGRARRSNEPCVVHVSDRRAPSSSLSCSGLEKTRQPKAGGRVKTAGQLLARSQREASRARPAAGSCRLRAPALSGPARRGRAAEAKSMRRTGTSALPAALRSSPSPQDSCFAGGVSTTLHSCWLRLWLCTTPGGCGSGPEVLRHPNP